MVRGIGPETFRSARKQAVFLSHESVPSQPNGRDRDEDKAGCFTNGPRAFNAEQIAQSCFHQRERVCQKVVVARNFEWFRPAVKPLKSSKAPTNYFTPNILRKSWSRLVVSVVHLDALAFPVAAT